MAGSLLRMREARCHLLLAKEEGGGGSWTSDIARCGRSGRSGDRVPVKNRYLLPLKDTKYGSGGGAALGNS